MICHYCQIPNDVYDTDAKYMITQGDSEIKIPTCDYHLKNGIQWFLKKSRTGIHQEKLSCKVESIIE